MSNVTEHSLLVSVASLIVWEPVQDADIGLWLISGFPIWSANCAPVKLSHKLASWWRSTRPNPIALCRRSERVYCRADSLKSFIPDSTDTHVSQQPASLDNAKLG